MSRPGSMAGRRHGGHDFRPSCGGTSVPVVISRADEYAAGVARSLTGGPHHRGAMPMSGDGLRAVAADNTGGVVSTPPLVPVSQIDTVFVMQGAAGQRLVDALLAAAPR